MASPTPRPLEDSVYSKNSNEDVRKQLLHEIFGRDDLYSIGEESVYSAYLAYLSRQCNEARAGQELCEPDRSFQDIIEVFPLIESSQSKGDIFHILKQRRRGRRSLIHDVVLTRTIDLAARILTMHETSRWDSAGQSSLTWTMPESLQDCLKDFHSTSKSEETVVLEKSFNARAIERLAGIEIVWTDSIAEHLRLRDHGDKQTVRIFHHATYLKALSAEKQKNLFPKNLLAETLETLALLFPHNDKSIRHWYNGKCAKEEYELDKGLLKCGRLNEAKRGIDQFHFWRDRLIILKQAYDEAEPTSMHQWWFDRRKKVQWATFWVAVLVLLLTVFFGFIQSIEGALQVYKAYHPSS